VAVVGDDGYSGVCFPHYPTGPWWRLNASFLSLIITIVIIVARRHPRWLTFESVSTRANKPSSIASRRSHSKNKKKVAA